MKKYMFLFLFLILYPNISFSEKPIKVKVLTKLAETDPSAQTELGYLYYTGNEVDRNYTKALEWYLKAAKHGEVQAQYNLGIMYENGEGVPKDEKKAFEWYLKAAKQGYGQAQYNLAAMYYNGKGVEQNYTKTFEWFLKAANQGDFEAQYFIGTLYSKGEGVPKDEKKVFEWYLKAAKQGYRIAQFNLGNIYSRGGGVEQNDAKAFEWYLKAAEQGHIPAQNNIAVMYKRGDGINQNYTKALEWYQKAYKKAYTNKIYVKKHLFKLLENGINGIIEEVKQNKEKYAEVLKWMENNALEWYQKATKQEFVKSKEDKNKILSENDKHIINTFQNLSTSLNINGFSYNRKETNCIGTLSVGPNITVGYNCDSGITDVKLPISISQELLAMAKNKGHKINMNMDLPFVVWLADTISKSDGEKQEVNGLKVVNTLNTALKYSKFKEIQSLILEYLENI